jgi:hypothetical protein
MTCDSVGLWIRSDGADFSVVPPTTCPSQRRRGNEEPPSTDRIQVSRPFARLLAAGPDAVGVSGFVQQSDAANLAMGLRV